MATTPSVNAALGSQGQSNFSRNYRVKQGGAPGRAHFIYEDEPAPQDAQRSKAKRPGTEGKGSTGA